MEKILNKLMNMKLGEIIMFLLVIIGFFSLIFLFFHITILYFK